MTEETNTPENVNAIEEYVNKGGSLDNLEVASRIASKRGNVVNYEYDINNPEGKTESGNVVTINLASDKFIGTVAIHEALHTLGEDKTSKMYEAIKTTEWHKENADKITKQYEEAEAIEEPNKSSLKAELSAYSYKCSFVVLSKYNRSRIRNNLLENSTLRCKAF